MDVRKRKRDRGQRAKDKDGVAAARERLKLSECIQRELVDYVSKEAGMGKIYSYKASQALHWATYCTGK